MQDIRSLEPQKVFQFFYEMNQIPRPSGHEKAVSDWLLHFAQERGLEVEQDATNNIIIRKPATPGYEKAPWVTIQGHMDMVGEKTADSSHDFLKDPIEMVVEDGFVHAVGTTLGADDGIAVAYALAILDSDDIPHPPLEVLITVSEETGMDGAMAIKEGQCRGEYLLNIDSEEEGIFTLGCAGGADLRIPFPAQREAAASGSQSWSIRIHGLRGGHSGQVIHEGRGNALKILARLLYGLKEADASFRLQDIGGGSKHNAIPVEARASFCTAGDPRTFLQDRFATIAKELKGIDPQVVMDLQTTENSPVAPIAAADGARLIDFLHLCPHGVQGMSAYVPGLVETSLNVAVLAANEAQDKYTLHLSLRSSVGSQKENLIERLSLLAARLGTTATKHSAYPAWEYNPESPLISRVKRVYSAMYGKEPTLNAIHAGLECGLLSAVMPHTYMISFGPNLLDIHTPGEHMEIASVARVYDFLKALLADFRNA